MHFLKLLVCLYPIFAHGVPIEQNKTRINSAHLLKEQLMAMIETVEGILTEYITNDMKCTNLAECEQMTTSLKLTLLPDFQDYNSESPQDLNPSLANNTNGLQDFNHFLQTFYYAQSAKMSAGSGDFQSTPTSLLSTGLYQQLKDVANLLFQFVLSLQADLLKTYCVEINITPLWDYPVCEECLQPPLPSEILQIVRNYQFLLQFRNFLSQFLDLYETFLISTSICS